MADEPTSGEMLHAAAVWYLEDGTGEAREALSAAASRFEVEGDKIAAVLREAVAERDAFVVGSLTGARPTAWHRSARAALGLGPLMRTVEYDGFFDLHWLGEDESVAAAGDGSGACVITDGFGQLVRRYDLGDTIEVPA